MNPACLICSSEVNITSLTSSYLRGLWGLGGKVNWDIKVKKLDMADKNLFSWVKFYPERGRMKYSKSLRSHPKYNRLNAWEPTII